MPIPERCARGVVQWYPLSPIDRLEVALETEQTLATKTARQVPARAPSDRAALGAHAFETCVSYSAGPRQG